MIPSDLSLRESSASWLSLLPVTSSENPFLLHGCVVWNLIIRVVAMNIVILQSAIIETLEVNDSKKKRDSTSAAPGMPSFRIELQGFDQ